MKVNHISNRYSLYFKGLFTTNNGATTNTFYHGQSLIVHKKHNMLLVFAGYGICYGHFPLIAKN